MVCASRGSVAASIRVVGVTSAGIRIYGVQNVPEIVRAKAYTSIANLGWGFDTFGLAVDVGFDTVSAERASWGLSLAVVGRYAEGIPDTLDQNTAGKAVIAMMVGEGLETGIRLEIDKGTRPGSGLGSSAASAVAAVVAVDALLELNTPRERLVRYASEGEQAAAAVAHTDNVGASLYGGFISCGSDGVVTPLAWSDRIRFAIAHPAIQVRTSDARAALPDQVDLKTYAEGCSRCARIIASADVGDARAFGAAVHGSFVDIARSRFIPGFDTVVAAARNAGAFGVIVSGGGPSVAAVVDDGMDASPVADAMQAAFASAGVACNTYMAASVKGAHVYETS